MVSNTSEKRAKQTKSGTINVTPYYLYTNNRYNFPLNLSVFVTLTRLRLLM